MPIKQSAQSAPKIVELIDRPNLIPTIVSWVQREWPKNRNDESVEHRICGAREREKLPSALIALSGNLPIGFISLVYYEKGVEVGRPHWIDAVYVEPSHRGQGVACELLREAERKAASMGIERLFALTEIPDFYKKSGWEAATGVKLDSPQDVIMTKNLSLGGV
jgi:predicted N-acetyltransferase YhbS